MLEILAILIIAVPSMLAIGLILSRFFGRVYWQTKIAELREEKTGKDRFWRNTLLGPPPDEYLLLTGEIDKENYERRQAEQRRKDGNGKKSGKAPTDFFDKLPDDVQNGNAEIVIRKRG